MFEFSSDVQDLQTAVSGLLSRPSMPQSLQFAPFCGCLIATCTSGSRLIFPVTVFPLPRLFGRLILKASTPHIPGAVVDPELRDSFLRYFICDRLNALKIPRQTTLDSRRINADDFANRALIAKAFLIK